MFPLAFSGFLVVALHVSSTSSPQVSPKPATPTTTSLNAAVLDELPFEDQTAFTLARRGFIAPLPDKVKNASGGLAWDATKYDFIKDGSASPAEVNPSLRRQSQVVNLGGLFKVVDGIYQIRNQDLSNMTIVEGDTGVIVIDPMISSETARAGLDLYRAHRGDKPVVGVIYSHSHVDHYGGVRGVVEEKDVSSGKVPLLAPVGFLEAAVAENVLAGNAMSRRASYMYGNLLPPDPKGQVGAGLGMTTSDGTVTLIPPTRTVTKNGQKEMIDGVDFEFLLTPGSEAPAEMHWYTDRYKALSTAENASHTLHNTYSLRGAKIRNPLKWSKYLNETIHLYADRAEVLYGMHHWPVWESAKLRTHLEQQRDMYRFINDQTLHRLNQGETMIEIAEDLELPEGISSHFSNRGYYGTVNHNVKATYVLYLGWFQGNPATLHRLPPVPAAKKYVEYMGGADAVLKNAKKSFDAGEYRWVAEVVNHVVFADPSNQAARNLQADALEQLGYQAESGPWRNFYLTGAQELRNGIAELPSVNTASPDTVKAMDVELLFDYFAMRVNGAEAASDPLVLNFRFTDTNQIVLVELSNGALNHIDGYQSDEADATVSLARSKLDAMLLGETSLAREIAAGHVNIEGDSKALQTVVGLLDTFKFWFPIVTP